MKNIVSEKHDSIIILSVFIIIALMVLILSILNKQDSIKYKHDCEANGGVIMISYPQIKSCVSKDYLLLPQLK